MTTREFKDRLTRRAKKAGVAMPADLAAALETYVRLLDLWNRKINLTAFRLDAEPDATIDRLLVEPLVAATFLPPDACGVMDIGSGGGSPAIPLKLAAPRISLTMVEAKTRKAAFLREAVRQLGLDRTDVETARFEELLSRPELHEAIDVVTLRAVRLDSRVLLNLQAFLRPKGQLFLFRGPGGLEPQVPVTPPLAWVATRQLSETLRSRLVILEKAVVGASR